MTEQQQRLLKARIAIALFQELGKRPTDQELMQFVRVLSDALSGYTITAPQGGKPC